MAKHRHRIFEMYDFPDEAVRALIPKPWLTETKAAPPQSWTLQHLDVSNSANVTRVKFKEAATFGDVTISELREDFGQLAEGLYRDSKVLLDFAGVESISPAAINALAQFNERLRTKGSRMVLCSLDPTARDCFFVAR